MSSRGDLQKNAFFSVFFAHVFFKARSKQGRDLVRSPPKVGRSASSTIGTCTATFWLGISCKSVKTPSGAGSCSKAVHGHVDDFPKARPNRKEVRTARFLESVKKTIDDQYKNGDGIAVKQLSREYECDCTTT